MSNKTKYTIEGYTVQRKYQRTKGKCSVEIGLADAKFTDEINKHLQIFLKDFGGKLIEQLKCDGIIFNGVTFQRFWIREKGKTSH